MLNWFVDIYSPLKWDRLDNKARGTILEEEAIRKKISNNLYL
jgi:hypothetical protein